MGSSLSLLQNIQIPKLHPFSLSCFQIKATAFGMRSVVYVPRLKVDTVAALSNFCEKASMVSTGWDFNSTLSSPSLSLFLLSYSILMVFVTGLSCGPNSLHWLYSPPASCNFSFIPLQQCRDCGIQRECTG